VKPNLRAASDRERRLAVSPLAIAAAAVIGLTRSDIAASKRPPAAISPMVPTVPAATFSPELADLTITAPSIESWREAQHAPLRAARRHLI
jgi:hypothetical protein